MYKSSIVFFLNDFKHRPISAESKPTFGNFRFLKTFANAYPRFTYVKENDIIYVSMKFQPKLHCDVIVMKARRMEIYMVIIILL